MRNELRGWVVPDRLDGGGTLFAHHSMLMTKKNDRPRTLQEDQDQHRSLQDDRAALQVDAEDDSPLVEGEGAPLAEDGVAAQPSPQDAGGTPMVLGGVPIITGAPLKRVDD
jgi:hypothetical protein